MIGLACQYTKGTRSRMHTQNLVEKNTHTHTRKHTAHPIITLQSQSGGLF